jgi:hypothetical protein
MFVASTAQVPWENVVSGFYDLFIWKNVESHKFSKYEFLRKGKLKLLINYFRYGSNTKSVLGENVVSGFYDLLYGKM